MKKAKRCFFQGSHRYAMVASDTAAKNSKLLNVKAVAKHCMALAGAGGGKK